MAERLQYPEILEVFAEDQEESEEGNEFIRHIDSTFSKLSSSASNINNNDSKVNRSCSGFVTPVVGDVGTCKTNQAAMSRSGSYQWLVFALVTFTTKATFVKQPSKFMDHLACITFCWRS